MIEKLIARTDAFLKGVAFDCRACGQCVLAQTGLICPMSCPKGLRNGPCGGTTNGRCEVYPDRDCVWVRIHARVGGQRVALPALLPSPDAELFHTSSYVNWLRGRDKYGRTPLTYLMLGPRRRQQPQQTGSRFEARLKEGRFVRTCELRSPRNSELDGVRREAAALAGVFDAVNVTAFLNAKPSLPSPTVAAELVRLGVEAICQSTCRDHTKTSFVSELIENHAHGVHNTLCVTGDSYATRPKIKQVWDMDAALMIYEARHLRETGRVHFTGDEIRAAPRPFIGGVINPFTTPGVVPIRRLKQKAAAGADFIQTQLVFDPDRFRDFMGRVCDEGIDEDLFMLAGIPVVTSRAARTFIPAIPGVACPPAVLERLAGAADPVRAGLALARELVAEVRAIRGVSGVHLMVLGPDRAVLPELAALL